MPQTSSADTAIEAAQKLAAALQNPHPAANIAPISAQQLEDLPQLAQTFDCTLTTDKEGQPRVKANENHIKKE